MGKSHVFDARSQMPVPPADLFSWHAREGAFERLSPPWETAEVVERTGDGIRPGARVVVRIHLGPIPQRLVAEHTGYVEGVSFQDTQREGPFVKWVHDHRMLRAGSPDASVLEDAIQYELPVGTLGDTFGGGYARKRLERMFAYRHTLTRADLRRHAAFADQGPLTVAMGGASGLLGSALSAFLTTGGHRVKRLVRGRANAARGDIPWAPDKGTVDAAGLEGVDAVVHLSGSNVGEGRWTPERKEEIRKSRTDSTRLLCETLARASRKPRVLICASAVGFYGNRGDAEVTEASSSGDGFLADVTRQWEASTAAAEAAGIRVVHLRIGVVLDARGGALAKLALATQAGGGGPVASGKQWLSWVALEDVLGLIQLSLFTPSIRGPLNAVSPNAVRQGELAKVLGRVLHRPAVFPLPAAVVKTVFGEMGEETLLSSTHALPTVAQAHRFPFLFPDLEGALRFTLGRTTDGAEYRHG
ncbi:TIGR01777 family oxidoreductase [Corallococcus sp. Z5C101001]|uniref:TIGR01777 family oxidoreductase n=1 Tax=Corallococcus sp. Z5C101001 TaxID=2596829 RepID=UPI00117D01B9|nr:TIGR01777 family oxidoreductase [Corallococcus sp. Z5C101001]TSC34002.1 TIGR01777 family protein [Corallococcus sp. Z5C101001]